MEDGKIHKIFIIISIFLMQLLCTYVPTYKIISDKYAEYFHITTTTTTTTISDDENATPYFDAKSNFRNIRGVAIKDIFIVISYHKSWENCMENLQI